MTDYIKREDAHRIAIQYGADPVAAKIMELPRVPVLIMTPARVKKIENMIDELCYGAEYGADYDLLERAAALFQEVLNGQPEVDKAEAFCRMMDDVIGPEMRRKEKNE